MKNLKRLLLITFILTFVSASGVYLYYNYTAPKYKTTTLPRITDPEKQAELRRQSGECNKRSLESVKLTINDEPIWDKRPVEVINSHIMHDIDSGRHRGERGVSLLEFIPAGKTVQYIELRACGDVSKMFAIEEFKNDPYAYTFVLNKRGSLKLLQHSAEGYTNRRLLKYIYQINLVQ